MPTLPTIDVTQAQADRLLAAFGSVAEYKAWLRQALVARVSFSESEKVRAKAMTDLDAVANPTVP